MQKEKTAEQPQEVSPLDAQLAIRQAAIELGARIPSTPEEVITFLESTDISSVRRISTAKALEMLRSGLGKEEIPEIPIEASIVEDFAMAARNGTALSAKVKELMAADRKKVEEEDQSSNA